MANTRNNFVWAALAVIFCFANVGLVSAQSRNAPATISVSKAPPSANDFAAAQDRSFAISPNGRFVTFISGEGTTARVILLTLETSQSREIPIGAGLKPRAVRWAGNDNILATLAYVERPPWATLARDPRWEITRTLSYSITSNEIKMIVPFENLQINTSLPIERVNSSDNSTILISGYTFFDTAGLLTDNRGGDIHSRFRLGLFEVNPSTGRGRRLTTGTNKTKEFYIDNNGDPRLRLDIDVRNEVTSLFVFANNDWKKLLEYNNAIELPFEIVGFLDSANAVVLTDQDNGTVAQKLDITTGTRTRIFEIESASIGGILSDPYSHLPIALLYDSLTPIIKWLDPQMERYQNALNRAFQGKNVYIESWDEGKTRLIIGVESGNFQYRSYLFDTRTRQVEDLSILPEGLVAETSSPKSLEKFRASDGTEIPAFVTRPSGSNGKKMPAIILPHGGPRANDDSGFDFISQYLASRGYIVIQPQFRGSTGVSIAFERAGHGEWAGLMQQDVTDAVNWAIAQGMVDPSRICILGASYGGYAALIGATLTPDLYACAISYGGVSDLAKLQNQAEEEQGRNSTSLAYWREHIGLSRFDTAKIQAISPVFQAARARVPILLIHGKDDVVVPITESINMANALRLAGKTYQFIELDGEDHWLSREASRERFLTEIERFLAPILRPDIQ